MARIATTNLALGTWEENENPSAGSQTVADAVGLNNNWLVLDTAVGTQHTAAGAHRDDTIGGASLLASIVDNSTLTYSAATGSKNFLIKDLGVSTAKLAAGAVTTAKLGTGAVTSNELGALAVIEAKINTGAVTNTKLGDDAVTSAKISHDNTRTKHQIAFSVSASTQYGVIGDLVTSASRKGIPMTRAGAITALHAVNSVGTKYYIEVAYSTGGTNHFAKQDLITVYDDTVYLSAYKNGSIMFNGVDMLGTQAEFVVLEIEFDD